LAEFGARDAFDRAVAEPLPVCLGQALLQRVGRKRRHHGAPARKNKECLGKIQGWLPRADRSGAGFPVGLGWAKSWVILALMMSRLMICSVLISTSAIAEQAHDPPATRTDAVDQPLGGRMSARGCAV